MNERIIQLQVYSLFQNYDYKLFNSFMFAWESDFFAISKSGYSVEVEVKISRSDFKADQKKIDKHHLLKHHKHPAVVERKYPFDPYINYRDREAGVVYDPDTWQYKQGDHSFLFLCCPAKRIPNKFYYAVPDGLIKVDEIPAWAGLIYITTGTERQYDSLGDKFVDKPCYTYKVIKQAPFLHKEVHDFKKTLLNKYYFKHYDIKSDVRSFIRSVNHHLTDYQKEAAEKLMRKFY